MKVKRLIAGMASLAIAISLLIFIPTVATASPVSSAPTVSTAKARCPSPARDPIGNILCTAHNEGKKLTRHYCQLAFSWNPTLLRICYRLAG